jgi:hypothetical protein
MKKFASLLFISLLSVTAHASEFVTLNVSKQSVAVVPTDIIQIVGVFQDSGAANLYLDYAGAGSNYAMMNIPANGGGGPLAFTAVTITGLTQVRLPVPNGSRHAVTIRITKTADEIASDPVVLPPVADGVYAVSIETSTDLENWAPAAPGDYLGDTTHRFFRVKALRKPQAPASGE